MIPTQAGRLPKGASSADDVIGLFLTPDGRLPGFAQRRLDDLIAKKRTEGLTPKEQRELSEALDYIDAKTIQMLEHALSRPADGAGSPPKRKPRRVGPKAAP